MATVTLTAGFANMVLVPGMIVTLEAVSPTTGAAITGVTATAWAIYGEDLGSSIDTYGGDVDGLSPDVVTWVWGDEDG